MKFFDFRLRPPSRGFLGMLMYDKPERRNNLTRMHGFEPAQSAIELSMDLLIQEMDAGDVAMGLIIGRESTRFGSISNEDVSAIVKDHPGRFVGAGSVDPLDRNQAIEKISELMESGFKIINLEPASYTIPMKADDAKMYPIYAHCENAEIPVIVMAGGNAGADLSSTVPVHIDRMAGDFPKLKIVVSHGGWPWVHQILHVAYRRDNIYISPDQYLAGMPGRRDYVEAADGFLADRFLYGSSYPFTPVKGYAEWFRGLPIKPENIKKVTYENAAALLGLDVNNFAGSTS